jgi:hypothetical protein
MATKPTDRILDWASGGTATDPGGSKESAGWVVSERPPAYWWNWILSSFGQWLTYFRDRPHIHYHGILTLGTTPSAAREQGDTVASFGDSGDTALVNLTTGVADYQDATILVSSRVTSATLSFNGTLLSNTQFQIGARDITNAGASVDLNSGNQVVTVAVVDGT